LPTDLHTPGHLPAETALALMRDAHPLLARLLAKALHPRRACCRLAVGDLGGDVGVIKGADDQDLIVVRLNSGRPGEPSLWQPPQHPAPDLVVRQYELHSYRLSSLRTPTDRTVLPQTFPGSGSVPN